MALLNLQSKQSKRQPEPCLLVVIPQMRNVALLCNTQHAFTIRLFIARQAKFWLNSSLVDLFHSRTYIHMDLDAKYYINSNQSALSLLEHQEIYGILLLIMIRMPSTS
jgi:hypothetical protein